MTPERIVLDAAVHYHERLAAFRAERVAPGGIVLIGASHFEWFETARFLPGRRFVNRGIASDRLGIGDRGILRRLTVSVVDVRPAFIVFNNAVNDLGELWRNGTPLFDEIVAAYDRVVGAIRAAAPGVPMLIVNELPVTGRFAGLNPLVRAFNPHVLATAERHGCGHLDFHSVVVDAAGALRAELTWDGLHLNGAGYTLWAEKLAPLLPASK